jgi:endonuclease YncB( thermonuclease family)
MKRPALVTFPPRTAQPFFAAAVLAFLLGLAFAGVISLDWQKLTARLAPDSVPPASLSTPDTAGRPVSRALVRVIDGDTIDLDGHRVRLVGFNAPETWTPACAAEAKAGNRAKARLRDLVASEPLSYRRVACSCAPGTEGTQACNYGRACGSLFAGGRDVGDILVAERLAVPYRCGRTACPPVPRPWCG